MGKRIIKTLNFFPSIHSATDFVLSVHDCDLVSDFILKHNDTDTYPEYPYIVEMEIINE